MRAENIRLVDAPVPAPEVKPDLARHVRWLRQGIQEAHGELAGAELGLHAGMQHTPGGTAEYRLVELGIERIEHVRRLVTRMAMTLESMAHEMGMRVDPDDTEASDATQS